MTYKLLRHIPAGIALIAASSVSAQTASFSLNGASGLIDMPTAQMLPDGETAWTFMNAGTVSGGTLTFQLLPNLETSVHFMTYADWTAPGQSYVNQSLNLKYQLIAETDSMPSLAVGSNNFLSNSEFSSEYIVASKDIGHGLTVTGGLGWGRLGSYEPIGSLRTRPSASGLGYDHFFSGDMALFGGVEWDTPVKGLSLKAEYSSDAYTGEQAFGDFTHESPFNVGMEYEPVRGVSIGGYYNYGSEFGLRLTLSGNPNNPVVSPDLGIGPVPVNPRPVSSDRSEGWAQNQMARDIIVGALATVLAAEGILIEEATLTGTTIDLYISNTAMPQTTKAIGRVARTLSVALPHSVNVFRITPVSGGVATTTVEILRSDLEAQVERPNAGPESWRTTQFIDANNSLGGDAWQREVDSKFTWSLNPVVPISLASNGDAASIDVFLSASASYRFSRGLAINGTVSQQLYGESSGVPAPGADDFDVASGNGLHLDRLAADYTFKLSPATYARVSAGYLERRFGGVTGEVLWMPTNQNWGLGMEISAVQGRADNDLFAFSDFQTVVGHGSVYWDTGYHGIEAQVDVGRYLAGDVGSTVSLSRRFANGWEVSGFVTVTDMPFDDFGDGDFAKGISVSIPLRWTLPMETRSATGVSLGTSGSGGALVDTGQSLHSMIRDYDVVDFNETWGAYWQ